MQKFVFGRLRRPRRGNVEVQATPAEEPAPAVSYPPEFPRPPKISSELEQKIVPDPEALAKEYASEIKSRPVPVQQKSQIEPPTVTAEPLSLSPRRRPRLRSNDQVPGPGLTDITPQPTEQALAAVSPSIHESGSESGESGSASTSLNHSIVHSQTNTISHYSPVSDTSAHPETRTRRILNRLTRRTIRDNHPPPSAFASSSSSPVASGSPQPPPSAWSTFGRKTVREAISNPHITDFTSKNTSSQSRSSSRSRHRTPNTTPSRSNSRPHTPSSTRRVTPPPEHADPETPVSPTYSYPSPPSSGFTFGSRHSRLSFWGGYGRSTPPPPMPPLNHPAFRRNDSSPLEGTKAGSTLDISLNAANFSVNPEDPPSTYGSPTKGPHSSTSLPVFHSFPSESSTESPRDRRRVEDVFNSRTPPRARSRSRAGSSLSGSQRKRWRRRQRVHTLSNVDNSIVNAEQSSIPVAMDDEGEHVVAEAQDGTSRGSQENVIGFWNKGAGVLGSPFSFQNVLRLGTANLPHPIGTEAFPASPSQKDPTDKPAPDQTERANMTEQPNEQEPRNESPSERTKGKRKAESEPVDDRGHSDEGTKSGDVQGDKQLSRPAIAVLRTLGRSSSRASTRGSQPPPSSYHRKRVRLSASGNELSSEYDPPRRSPSQLSHASKTSQASQTSRLSRSSRSSIPVSAIITPHAPSTGIIPPSRTVYHMQDPRKPTIRPTSWALSLPNPEPHPPSRKTTRSKIDDIARAKLNISLPKALGKGRKSKDKLKEKDVERGSVGGATVQGATSWIARGGSPLHSWLFFVGFILFPVWWVAAFLPVDRPRPQPEQHEKQGTAKNKQSSSELIQSQLLHDVLSWRRRCRIMAVVALFTYVPFIILVAVFVPRSRR